MEASQLFPIADLSSNSTSFTGNSCFSTNDFLPKVFESFLQAKEIITNSPMAEKIDEK